MVLPLESLLRLKSTLFRGWRGSLEKRKILKLLTILPLDFTEHHYWCFLTLPASAGHLDM